MTAIGVVHMDLMAKGGGEAVAMNVLEALQRDHDVTLLTIAKPDFDELNVFFNTAVDPSTLTVDRTGWPVRLLHWRYDFHYYILQNALLARYARKREDDFDLLVSTINELPLGRKAVQYIHFPFDWAARGSQREHIFHPTVENGSLYERLCTWLGDVDVDKISSDRLFANSPWTASVVEDAYGTDVDVLYPPVDTEPFVDTPWAAREAGFVTVGRIERSKRIIEMIDILDALRERGHDLHLHVIGPVVSEAYMREIETRAADRPYVHLDGELPRAQLVDRICSHRYGLHAKRYEHFGMAVAELLAGGAVTFVPANGGQRDIVGRDERLTFDGVGDAIETIDRVVGDEELARSLRKRPEDLEAMFGRERFRDRFRDVVHRALDPDRPIGDLPASAPRMHP